MSSRVASVHLAEHLTPASAVSPVDAAPVAEHLDRFQAPGQGFGHAGVELDAAARHALHQPLSTSTALPDAHPPAYAQLQVADHRRPSTESVPVLPAPADWSADAEAVAAHHPAIRTTRDSFPSGGSAVGPTSPVAPPFVAPPYLQPLRLVAPAEEQYHRVVYQLCAALRSVQPTVLAVHAVNAPEQDELFERNHAGTTVLDSWVHAADLPASNSVQSILRHGGRFRIPDVNQGAVFRVGCLDLTAAADSPAAAGQPLLFEFVLFRVATGRSLAVSRDAVGTTAIPDGYESIAVHDTAADPFVASVQAQAQQAEAEGGAPIPRDQGPAALPSAYTREYVVNDESRVYPAFVVTFLFDPRPAAAGHGAAPYLRPVSGLAERDAAIDSLASAAGSAPCPVNGLPLQYFDTVTNEALCVRCKMEGGHSTGPSAQHPLVPLRDAFAASMADLRQEDVIVAGREAAVRDQIVALSRKRAAVLANSEQCQAQVFEAVQRITAVLQQETDAKLDAIRSDESELARQLASYTHMRGFLADQSVAVGHLEFLRAFRCHSAAMAAAPSEVVATSATVQPDMKIQGDLQVIVSERQRQSAARGVPMASAPAGPTLTVIPPVAAVPLHGASLAPQSPAPSAPAGRGYGGPDPQRRVHFPSRDQHSQLGHQALASVGVSRSGSQAGLGFRPTVGSDSFRRPPANGGPSASAPPVAVSWAPTPPDARQRDLTPLPGGAYNPQAPGAQFFGYAGGAVGRVPVSSGLYR